jgi:hypothetical protein
VAELSTYEGLLMTTARHLVLVTLCGATAAEPESSRFCQKPCGTITDTVSAEAYFTAIINAGISVSIYVSCSQACGPVFTLFFYSTGILA